MITKKQFCEIKIKEYCKDNNISIDELEEGMCFTSSTLAVCMEYLGLLKDNSIKEYVASRGGTMYVYGNRETGEVAILSIREFINLLPESL